MDMVLLDWVVRFNFLSIGVLPKPGKSRQKSGWPELARLFLPGTRI
ncbi:MAG: hypothetical protein ACM31N_11470 [Deltaproteobacteria bacterium]